MYASFCATRDLFLLQVKLQRGWVGITLILTHITLHKRSFLLPPFSVSYPPSSLLLRFLHSPTSPPLFHTLLTHYSPTRNGPPVKSIISCPSKKHYLLAAWMRSEKRCMRKRETTMRLPERKSPNNKSQCSCIHGIQTFDAGSHIPYLRHTHTRRVGVWCQRVIRQSLREEP